MLNGDQRRALTHVRATDPRPPTFLARMEGLDLVDADLRKTGISIGKHPMAFVRDEMTRRGILTAQQSLDLKRTRSSRSPVLSSFASGR